MLLSRLVESIWAKALGQDATQLAVAEKRDLLERLLARLAHEIQAVMAENNELRQRLQKGSEPSLLVGESESMRAINRLVQEVANSDVIVLIEGESGTGKEIVARSIHLQSSRRERPFISVNCAALAEQLLGAELFGHVKGAFTGAIANKPGRFQLADGTLFLDEIGDLSPKGQGDLLRVIEDGAFRMVGGSELIRVNVRAPNINDAATECLPRRFSFASDFPGRAMYVSSEM